eukprot:2282120-Rhodomonas_salina.1
MSCGRDSLSRREVGAVVLGVALSAPMMAGAEVGSGRMRDVRRKLLLGEAEEEKELEEEEKRPAGPSMRELREQHETYLKEFEHESEEVAMAVEAPSPLSS